MESIVLTKESCFSRLPVRTPESHKGNYGKLLCYCGSEQYRGAAALSVLGGLRVGTGLVTLAAEEVVISSVASRILEAVFLSLPNWSALAHSLRNSTAVLAGCGLTEDTVIANQMRYLLKSVAGTLVLDAGGLCTFVDDTMALCHTQAPLILTPHVGEMARLAGISVGRVLQMPADIALSFAKKTNAIVVLKRHHTLIATPDGTLFENRTGNAGLARGGSGDVLAGMIAGLAAQGLSALDAAICGVYLHGAAADLCAARSSMQGMLPEDILRDLHTLFIEHETQT
ncbi:MAG: NAD(P)H-hydrate dehydratase [Ruthenibacterium sp.]